MELRVFKLIFQALLLSALVSACGSNQRGKKMTPYQSGRGIPNTTKAAGLDKWVDSERAKSDSEFKKSHPEQSTVGLTVAAIKGYSKSIRPEVDKSNKELQQILRYVEISAQPNADKQISVKVEVFDSRVKTTRKKMLNLVGNIGTEDGVGQLKAEYVDPDLNKQLVAPQKSVVMQKEKNKPTPATTEKAVKGERFTGDAKCFDKECYNIIVRIFDHKAGAFLAYLYREVNFPDQNSELKARIFEPLRKSLEVRLSELNRSDVLNKGNIEKDGFDFKMTLGSGKFGFKALYSVSLISGEYNMKLQIKEESKNETEYIRGAHSGSISDSELDEWTFLIKN